MLILSFIIVEGEGGVAPSGQAGRVDGLGGGGGAVIGGEL